MAWTEQRLDDSERSRRRLRLLAELAGAKSLCKREYQRHPQRARGDRIRELIATRRRLAN